MPLLKFKVCPASRWQRHELVPGGWVIRFLWQTNCEAIHCDGHGVGMVQLLQLRQEVCCCPCNAYLLQTSKHKVDNGCSLDCLVGKEIKAPLNDSGWLDLALIDWRKIQAFLTTWSFSSVNRNCRDRWRASVTYAVIADLPFSPCCDLKKKKKKENIFKISYTSFSMKTGSEWPLPEFLCAQLDVGHQKSRQPSVQREGTWPSGWSPGMVRF